MIYFCIGIMPVNIGNLLLYLPGTSKFGLGVVMASFLTVGTISILMFGYLGDKISRKYSRKKIFVLTNLLWVAAYGLVSLSLNYYFYLFFFMLAAFGAGSFLPIGFSIIGDIYSPKERGVRFGTMQFGANLGSGLGVIMGGLLGTYAGLNGWRFAYGLGFTIGLLVVINYYFSGIDPKQGGSEPEFEEFKAELNYNYKITRENLIQLFKKKSIAGILIFTLCSGICTSTLGIWAIFYLTTKINDIEAGFFITTIYLLAGIGALPGTIMGGKLGDSLYHSGKIKGRVIISIVGLIMGITCFFGFYLIPFFIATTLEIVFSWIFFITIGFLGFFFTSLCVGNIYAIYSEVCVPELRCTANALNGVMVNIGGIIGNLLLSSLIESDISLLTFAISLVLLIYLFGTIFWIIPYFYYPKESIMLRNLMADRLRELKG